MNFESLFLAGSRAQVRKYQEEVVTECYNRFFGLHVSKSGHVSPPHKSILVESPTGSGKTFMGMMLAKAMQREIPDLVVVWEAMRKPLLAQAVRTNEEMVGLKNFHAISMFANDVSEVEALRDSGRKILHVCDEAQHSAASSSAHLHNIIKPDYVLGLSATPYRTDNQKLCFEAVVKNAGIHALIDAGYLSNYDHYTITEYTPARVLETYLSDIQKWGKSIFYFLTISQCMEFAVGLRAAGVKCDVVTGDSDKDSQIAAFENGDYDCLINCMVLTEGFDCPSLKTAWVRDSSKSPTVQMCGRVLRVFEELPVKQIVQSTKTSWPFQRTASPRQSYVMQDGVWKSLKANEKINEIQRASLHAIAALDVEMPKFISDRAKRPRRVVF